jgi:hypothetical protein
MHKAAKSYMDGKGRMISAGDTMPDDYDTPTLEHYKRLGIVGEAAEKPGKKAKSAAPTETKTTEQGAE